MEDYLKAHKHSFENEDEINRSLLCGCFYCQRIFPSAMLQEIDWTQDRNAKTALCPYCMIDAVIGDASGFDLTEELLAKMCDYWF